MGIDPSRKAHRSTAVALLWGMLPVIIPHLLLRRGGHGAVHHPCGHRSSPAREPLLVPLLSSRLSADLWLPLDPVWLPSAAASFRPWDVSLRDAPLTLMGFAWASLEVCTWKQAPNPTGALGTSPRWDAESCVL